MSQSKIFVAGLKDVRKGLRAVDTDLPKAMRAALNTVADVLVDATRPKIPSVTGAARASLRSSSTQTAARVAAGGPKAPYEPWLDFGGAVGRKKATVRPFYRAGRYVYPTLEEQRDNIEAAMLKAVAMLAGDNGIGVS